MKRKWFWWIVPAVILAPAAAIYLLTVDNQLRGGALDSAMSPIVKVSDSDGSVVGEAILKNYWETRQIAALWSGLYWGFAWGSAVLSALAGLILKAESIDWSDQRKKDIASLLTVVAALMVTISTSGDFQRKWQANRTAAAEIERTGYDFLEHNGQNARSYFEQVRESLYRRHMAILGGSERTERTPGASAPNAK